jgi:hypothetical protein
MIPFYFRTLTVLALALATPSEEFERGRTAFLRGEYERAVSIIHPLVYPDLRLDSEAAVIQAHRMLGVSYLFENKPDEARSEFRKLLELAPDYRFDPFLDPPTVVEFFNGIVREQQRELGDIEMRLKKREDELARRSNQILERRIEQRSYVVNFIPFGAGQFQNQQRRKGWAFLGVEGGLAVVSVAAFATNFALYGARPVRPCLDTVAPDPMTGAPGLCPTTRVDHSGEDVSRDLTRVQVITGGLFFAVAIWGIVDALGNFRDEVPAGEIYVPGAPRPAPPVSPPASSPASVSPATSMRLGPMLGPFAQGAALTLTF